MWTTLIETITSIIILIVFLVVFKWTTRKWRNNNNGENYPILTQDEEEMINQIQKELDEYWWFFNPLHPELPNNIWSNDDIK